MKSSTRLDRRILLARALSLSAGGLASSREAHTGTWDVVETVWAAPGSPPVVARGLVAERRMVGTLLTETISSEGEIRRLGFLTYKQSEER